MMQIYILYVYVLVYTDVSIFDKDANDVQISVVSFRVFHNMLILFWNYRMEKQQQSLILIIHIGRWCMKSTRLDYHKQVTLRFFGSWHTIIHAKVEHERQISQQILSPLFLPCLHHLTLVSVEDETSLYGLISKILLFSMFVTL